MNPPNQQQPVSVLAFAGSLREGSYNKALLRAAAELAPDQMSIEVFDLAGIPLYNADVEAEGDPKRVTELKEAIRNADAVLVATPEYNYGVSGVTKNAIDWASRPAGDSSLDGKPVGVIGASPSITGTARGQSQLRQAFQYNNAYALQQPEILVYKAKEKFDSQGKLTDEKTREFLGKYLEKLYEWTLNFRQSRVAAGVGES